MVLRLLHLLLHSLPTVAMHRRHWRNVPIRKAMRLLLLMLVGVCGGNIHLASMVH